MTAAGHYMKALTFALQGEIFAIDAEGVREILDLVPITEVPSAPDFADPLPVRLGEPLAKVLSDLAVPRQRIEAVFLDVGRHLIDASRLLGSISAIFEGLASRLPGEIAHGNSFGNGP